MIQNANSFIKSLRVLETFFPPLKKQKKTKNQPFPQAKQEQLHFHDGETCYSNSLTPVPIKQREAGCALRPWATGTCQCTGGREWTGEPGRLDSLHPVSACLIGTCCQQPMFQGCGNNGAGRSSEGTSMYRALSLPGRPVKKKVT